MSCGAAASLSQLPSLAPSPPMFPWFLTPEINHKPSLRNACSHALAQPEGLPHAAAELAEQQESSWLTSALDYEAAIDNGASAPGGTRGLKVCRARTCPVSLSQRPLLIAGTAKWVKA